MICPKCGTDVENMMALSVHYNDSHKDTTAALYSQVAEYREAVMKEEAASKETEETVVESSQDEVPISPPVELK